MQFGVNKHLYIFQRLQIARDRRASAILLSLKNWLLFINTKLLSQSCYYLYFI